MEFHGDWWQRESVDYLAWMEGNVARLELHGPKPDNGSEDEEEEENEEVKADYAVGMLFA